MKIVRSIKATIYTTDRTSFEVRLHFDNKNGFDQFLQLPSDSGLEVTTEFGRKLEVVKAQLTNVTVDVGEEPNYFFASFAGISHSEILNAILHRASGKRTRSAERFGSGVLEYEFVQPSREPNNPDFVVRVYAAPESRVGEYQLFSVEGHYYPLGRD